MRLVGPSSFSLDFLFFSVASKFFPPKLMQTLPAICRVITPLLFCFVVRGYVGQAFPISPANGPPQIQLIDRTRLAIGLPFFPFAKCRLQISRHCVTDFAFRVVFRPSERRQLSTKISPPLFFPFEYGRRVLKPFPRPYSVLIIAIACAVMLFNDFPPRRRTTAPPLFTSKVVFFPIERTQILLMRFSKD